MIVETDELKRHNALVERLPVERFELEWTREANIMALRTLTADSNAPYLATQATREVIEEENEKIHQIDTIIPLMITRAKSLGSDVVESTVSAFDEMKNLLAYARSTGDWKLENGE